MVGNKKGEVIRLKNVAKHYHLGENVVKALDGIDVLINAGDFVSIMG
ncbi:ABC transporter ATP-binding protein, partial [Nocardia farcinica]|nr:ABC transporter ATP-binding protein [Nocardia farcinica]